MDINNIRSATSSDTLSVQKLDTAVATKYKSSDSEQSSEGRYDSFKQSSKSTDETGIYSKESIAEQLKAGEELRQKAFTNFIQGMVTDQMDSSNFSFMGLDLFVTEDDSAKALASISDGGEYSVDSVATRIMDMAEALSGGDESKLSILRKAVQDGFGQAASKLGLKDDEMPDITHKTYDEVMNRFDKWEASFKPETETTETEK